MINYNLSSCRTVSGCNEAVKKLYSDMHAVTSREASEQEVLEYCRKAIRDRTGYHGKAYVWAPLVPLRGMGSDAFCAVVMIPTYIITGILIRAYTDYESVRTVPDIRRTIADALHACALNGLHGHGYEDYDGLVSAMEIFAECGVDSFIRSEPDLCPEFTCLYESAKEYLRNEVTNSTDSCKFGGRTHAEAAEILSKLSFDPDDNELLFVYGTLMRGQPADSMLEGCRYLGRYVLEDYALYELGSYPGIRPFESQSVPGELYSIPQSLLKDLDRYESEGSLYTRTELEVGNGFDNVRAWVYVYNRDVFTGMIPSYLLPYRSYNPDDYVWYVSYGSNMLKERFMCYIKGGECRFNGRHYRGCDDRTPPVKSFAVSIPHSMYFGYSSGSWDGSSVSFLEPEEGGSCMGRAWLITRAQFERVHTQEGAGENWYNLPLSLGTIDGIEAVTFTHDTKYEETEPSEIYLDVVKRGMRETEEIPWAAIVPVRS